MGILDRLRRGRSGGEPEPYVYPLERTNERTYPPDFEGDIFVWDIDKTYLATEFETMRGLLTIPFEFAVDKRNIAATDVLIKALRRGPSGDGPRMSNPLYFISASPVQLRGVITRKMLLDGVEYDGVTFKDHLAILRSRKVSRIKEQIGYKLSALLRNRQDLPWNVRETLFGDDSEADALIYSIYADVVAGRLRGDALRATLLKNGVDHEDATYATTLAAGMDKRELVSHIYINLEKRSPPSRFAAYDRRLIPCYDTLQAALHLFQTKKIDQAAVLAVGRELANEHRRTPVALLRSALELVERRALKIETLKALWEPLREAELVPRYLKLDEAAVTREPERKKQDFVTPQEHLSLSVG